MPDFSLVMTTALAAVAILLVLKLVWRVTWGFINWLADRRVRKKNPEAYELLIPMVDYTPFYDLFADEETLERRFYSNSAREYIRQRSRRKL